MIILLHPRATKPKNRRFPLSILSLAAVLEGKAEYSIVDGNIDPHPERMLDSIVRNHDVELLAVSAAELGFETDTASLADIYARAQELPPTHRAPLPPMTP